MDTNFSDARSDFDAWMGRMLVPQSNRTTKAAAHSMAYGLVAVGIFLLANHKYEAFRSELMGIYGLEWFNVAPEKWRDTKEAIYTGSIRSAVAA